MKNAIVTGGTSGIGLGIAKMLLKKGYRVYATYVSHNYKENIENFIQLKVDQTQRKSVYNLIEKIRKECSHIDCIVCNAGISIRKSFTETTDEDWDNQMEVAVNSHYIIIKRLYDLIPNGSRILFTGSQMAVHPHATVLSYGVTKSAVCSLARNLVKEFEGTNTTVNAIIPGFVDTPWQKDKPEEIKQNIYKKTAIHRFASIEEVVKAYEFCIDNAFVNGSMIEVNGGYCYK